MELGLSLVALIGVIIAGIHFGEIGMLGVKVTEASAAALWDTTGRSPHDYEGGRLNTDFDDVAQRTQGRISGQYADFDGRDSSTGTSPQMVFTRGDNVEVTCEDLDNGVLPRLRIHAAINNTVFRQDSHGGVRCRSASSVSLIPGSAPREVFVQEGWLKGPILKASQIPVCGIGRAVNGACNDGVPMLVGDWALANRDEDEHEECALGRSNCDNRGYYDAVERFYNRIGPKGLKGTQFAMEIIGMSPLMLEGGTETKFFMSFRGEESGFQEEIDTANGTRTSFTVTPGGPANGSVKEYDEAFDERENCWLGMKCEDY